MPGFTQPTMLPLHPTPTTKGNNPQLPSQEISSSLFPSQSWGYSFPRGRPLGSASARYSYKGNSSFSWSRPHTTRKHYQNPNRKSSSYTRHNASRIELISHEPTLLHLGHLSQVSNDYPGSRIKQFSDAWHSTPLMNPNSHTRMPLEMDISLFRSIPE